LIAYVSPISLLSWNHFPKNSGFRKALKSRVESKMAADPEGFDKEQIVTFII